MLKYPFDMMVMSDQYFEVTYPFKSSMKRNFAHADFSSRHRPGVDCIFLLLLSNRVR